MFAVAPCCSGGVVYYKRTSMDAIAFAAGAGTPFLRSSTNTKINNPASTKQNLTDASGLLVIASDYSARRYLHNAIDLSTGTFAVRKTG
jgi:hypothetical protein